MSRSVCKFGLAAALVLGALAFGAAPAQAQVYVTGSPAQAPAQAQVYVTGSPATAPVYSYTCSPTYYYPSYTSYCCSPTYYYYPSYTSYCCVPTYRYYHSCGWGWRACGWRVCGWRSWCCGW